MVQDDFLVIAYSFLGMLVSVYVYLYIYVC